MRRQWVYFIKPIGMDGPVKIGCSCAPDNRRQTLETWSPFPLEIVAEIEGDYGIERRFHGKFYSSARGREWFNLTPELTATIEAIRAGNFDTAGLPDPMTLSAFRKPRDNSYATPGWRYQRSVLGRYWRHRWVPWTPFLNEITAITGGGIFGQDQMLKHKDQIEAMLARLVAEAKRQKAAA